MRTSLWKQTEKNSAREYLFPLCSILAHFTELRADCSPMWDVQLDEWPKRLSQRLNKLNTGRDDVVAKSETGLLASSHPYIGLEEGWG
ncbi:hypothetical protein ABIG04_009976 [Bradyrhizobium japonicum]